MDQGLILLAATSATSVPRPCGSWCTSPPSGTVRFVDFDRVERREDGTVQTHEPVDQLPLLDDVPARR